MSRSKMFLSVDVVCWLRQLNSPCICDDTGVVASTPLKLTTDIGDDGSTWALLDVSCLLTGGVDTIVIDTIHRPGHVCRAPFRTSQRL